VRIYECAEEWKSQSADKRVDLFIERKLPYAENLLVAATA
jgi:hypothetical protein